MDTTRKFFDRLRDHTEIKLRILAKFIKPWSAKLGYKVRARGGNRIWYVDGFAGPGRYEDGSDGSPIIGALRAREVLHEARGHILGCINVELKRNTFAQLERNTRSYRDEGVPIHNLQGAFSARMAEIMRIVGSDAPLLTFVDPFGISPLVFDALKPLLRRRGETDLILTFQTRAIYRLVTDHPDYVSRAVGSDRWMESWDREGVDAVRRALSDNLARSGGFLGVAQYPIRQGRDAAPKYDLIMASRNYDAFELLNDFVCEEEDALDWKAYAQTSQMSFLRDVDAEMEEQALIDAILEFGKTHRRTTRQAIRESIVIDRWANWHTTEINRAVQALIQIDRLKRPMRRHIDSDPLEFQ